MVPREENVCDYRFVKGLLRVEVILISVLFSVEFSVVESCWTTQESELDNDNPEDQTYCTDSETM